MITHLTPEQEALIPVYLEKWRKLGLSTEPLVRNKAQETVKMIYSTINELEPEVIFFNSPYATVNNVLSQRTNRELRTKIYSAFHQKLWYEIESKVEEELWTYLQNCLYKPLWRQLHAQLSMCLWFNLGCKYQIDYRIALGQAACHGSLFDFCISVLNSPHDASTWLYFQTMVKDCDWIFPFEKLCMVCDRPRILSFDNQQRLHAEGKPAISFADGFSVYAYHGVTLPEKYGKLHPSEWRSQWLLEEKNAEIRRVLIQGIGYSRICQELQATQLDYWQEYTLLKIESDVDVELIYLLKMTCPSTGYINALRVPPDINSARQAICWVNWGTDPEEFSVQT